MSSDEDIFEDILRSMLKDPRALAIFNGMFPSILTMPSFKDIILLLLGDPFVFVDLEWSLIDTIITALGEV